MSRYYVACELGIESGRVILGTLHQDRLTLSEVRRFQNLPFTEKNSLQWDIPALYQETLEGLRGVGAYDEPVEGISCHSWAGDYLLFEADGSLIRPAYHHCDSRTEAGRKAVLSRIPAETLYAESGIPQMPQNSLFQLGAETSRRLNGARHLLPIADGFNFLLAGVPRVEVSLAGTTQLYNPVTQTWSARLLDAMRLPSKLLPPLVAAGTELGALRADIAKDARLEDARVISSCSHEIAAALAGLPVAEGEKCAYLAPGAWAVVGTQVAEPIINQASRELSFSNQRGYGGSVCFHKHTVGLWLLEECQRYWEKTDSAVDADLLSHLAGSAPPFASLINPADPRLLAPGDMPAKIQAFCRETRQPIPRKPGPIFRCILESLALLYRKTLLEIEYLTGSKLTRLYLIGGSSNSLLNHFITNAVQLPVVIAPADAAAIGNVAVQALALGHVQSLKHAREIVRGSFKMQTLLPHAAAWNSAYDRLVALSAVS